MSSSDTSLALPGTLLLLLRFPGGDASFALLVLPRRAPCTLPLCGDDDDENKENGDDNDDGDIHCGPRPFLCYFLAARFDAADFDERLDALRPVAALRVAFFRVVALF